MRLARALYGLTVIWMIFAAMVLFLWAATRVACGQWVRAPEPRRQSTGGHLGDIVSRVGSPGTYTDSDLVTTAHESTHGYNSDLRQIYGSGMNCFYVLNGYAAVVAEPRTTLAAIAARVPPEKRGRNFQLYLVSQRRYGNSEPLYLLDELSAYLNGATVAAELNIPDRFRDSFASSVEFVTYAHVLLNTVPPDYDATPLRNVIRHQIARCLLLREFAINRGWYGGNP